jgi:hypothetical protein
LNAAVTERAALIVTLRVVVPVPSPLHAENVDPAAVGNVPLGVAVSTTVDPSLNAKPHVPEVVPPVLVQLMPAGLLVTVPTPAPVPETVSVWVAALTASVLVPVDVAQPGAATTVAVTPLAYVPTAIPDRLALLSETLPPPFVVPEPTALPFRKKLTVAPPTLPPAVNETCADRFTVLPNVPVAAATVVVVAGEMTTRSTGPEVTGLVV